MRFFPITAALAALSSFATASPIDLETRQSGCATLFHINAAGTSERGLGIVGNAMQDSLPPQVAGATVQALNYDTSAEYVVTVRAGANELASLVTSLAARCPNAKFSLSGYSKGALVLHQTDLPANVQSRVVAVAVFGDPSARTGSQGIPLNDQSCFFAYCNTGDVFCTGRGTVIPHLAYARDGSVRDAAGKIAACYRK